MCEGNGKGEERKCIVYSVSIVYRKEADIGEGRRKGRREMGRRDKEDGRKGNK